jgi:tRNA(Arg) A34 adenosine deaminase TadA
MDHPNEALMREAIADGFSQSTVGCLIVRGDEVIARGRGTIFSEHDPTGHSELNAIRAASRLLGTHELRGCWLYTTFEPCPMCMAAICWAKMDGVVYAASHEDRNERWTWEVVISAEEVASRSQHEPKVIGPFLREESLTILDL